MIETIEQAKYESLRLHGYAGTKSELEPETQEYWEAPYWILKFENGTCLVPVNLIRKDTPMLVTIHFEIAHLDEKPVSGDMSIEAQSEERALEVAEYRLEDEYPGDNGWTLLECRIV